MEKYQWKIVVAGNSVNKRRGRRDKVSSRVRPFLVYNVGCEKCIEPT